MLFFVSEKMAISSKSTAVFQPLPLKSSLRDFSISGNEREDLSRSVNKVRDSSRGRAVGKIVIARNISARPPAETILLRSVRNRRVRKRLGEAVYIL